MKQKRPFQVRVDNTIKASLHSLARDRGKPYGIFFSTSGKALIEPVNPNAQYGYVFRTDRDP